MESAQNLSVTQITEQLLSLAAELMQAVKAQAVDEMKKLELGQRQLLQQLKERASQFPKELDASAKKKLQQYQLLNDQYLKEIGKHFAVVHFDNPRAEIDRLLK